MRDCECNSDHGARLYTLAGLEATFWAAYLEIALAFCSSYLLFEGPAEVSKRRKYCRLAFKGAIPCNSSSRCHLFCCRSGSRMSTLLQVVFSEEPAPPARIQGEILLPGARSLVAFVAAWDQLVQILTLSMLMHSVHCPFARRRALVLC